MSLFMVEWTSLDVKATTSLFVSGAFPIQPPLKLVSSVHIVGEPKGFALLDGSAEDVYALTLALPPNILDLVIYPVVDDKGVKPGLDHRNSAYKVK